MVHLESKTVSHVGCEERPVIEREWRGGRGEKVRKRRSEGNLHHNCSNVGGSVMPYMYVLLVSP